VIVNGRVLKNMPAREYFAYKKTLIPDIKKAFKKLEEYADIIVIEGAGSPAEINLKENDIVAGMFLSTLPFTITCEPVLFVGFKRIGFMHTIGLMPAASACITWARPISSPSSVI